MLSKNALILLEQLFDEKSNLQLPVSMMDNAVIVIITEIRGWLREEIKKV